MSATLNSTDQLLRTTNIIPGSSDWIYSFWFKLNSDAGVSTYQSLFTLEDSSPAFEKFVQVFTEDLGVGPAIGLALSNNVSFVAINGSVVDVDQWNYATITKRGSTHRLYLNGILQGSPTVLTFSAATFDSLYLGYDTFSTDDFDIAAYREWDTAFPVFAQEQADILSEMNSEINAVRSASLIANTPLESDLLDISGNGNDWSASGSVSFSAQPPFPANSEASGAIDIGTIPANITQNLVAGGITWDAWYKYTANANKEIGVWGFGNLVDFSPTVTVWSPDGVTPFPSSPDQIAGVNVPIQVPVENGITYFFRYRSNAQNLAVANIEIDAINHTPVGRVIGAICINDDDSGFPLALLSPDVTDLVYEFIAPFASGEAGDILNNGVILVTNVDTQEYVGYDANYSEIFRSVGQVVLTTVGGTIRQCRGTQRFWIGLSTGGVNTSARFVEDDGTLGTSHVIGAIATIRLRSLAANNDETILYYGVEAGAHNGKVRAYNLLTDTIIGDFAAAIAGYGISDILILSDDTILVCYSNSSTKDVKVLRYNAAGAILNTYEFGIDHNFPSGSIARIAYSLDDPDTFWIYEQLASTIGVSKFSEIAIVDGSVVRSVNHTIYETGVHLGAAVVDPIRFGHSFSCPFWVATQGETPVLLGTLTVGKVTDPYSPGVDFVIDVGGGLTPAQITLQSDEEHVYDPCPVGVYSVVEDTPTGYFTFYFVSNDPTNDNLNVVVGEGENVSVVVLNTRGGGGTFTTTPSTPSGPPIPPHDETPNPDGEGAPIAVAIPNPFYITGGIRDHN